MAALPVAVAEAPAAPAAAATPASVRNGQQPHPEVDFNSRQLTLALEPGATCATLQYHFTNRADLPLAVEDFVHTCGCMIGSWDGEPVEPGGRGVITARFHTEGRRGIIRKSLRVRFVAIGTVELAATVTVPETLEYSATTVRWRVGAAPEPRVVDIMVNGANPVRVLAASGDSSFGVFLETVEEGRRYRITITPADTSSARVGVFQVRTDSKDPRDALQGLFGLVERSDAAPPQGAAGKGGAP